MKVFDKTATPHKHEKVFFTSLQPQNMAVSLAILWQSGEKNTGILTVQEMMRRVAAHDAASIYLLGNFYQHGINGLQQDQTRAIEHVESENLGYSQAHHQLADIYHQRGDEEGQVPLRGCGYGRARRSQIQPWKLGV